MITINCCNDDCRYYKLTFVTFDGKLRDVDLCTKFNTEIDFDKDYDFDCSGFEELKFCDTCKYGSIQWYDWDDVTYYCKLQNNKTIHNQCSSVLQTEILPRCNINKYQID